VAIWTLETLDEIASSGIPDADAFVERSGCNELGVWGDGDSGDTILDTESEDVLTSFDVPETDSAVTATGSDSAAITGKVERVDILLVPSECVSDGSRGNIPYSDQLVLGTGSKVSSIRAEADASDVKISNCVDRVVLENANLLSGHNVEDLCGSVAAGSNIFSIVAESNTTDNAFVLKSVNEIHIKDAGHQWVKDSKPISLYLLLMGRKALKVQLSKGVSNAELSSSVVRNGVSDLRRGGSPRIWVWHLLIQLGCGWTAWTAIQARAFAWSGRGGRLGRLRSVAVWCWALRIATTLKLGCLRLRWRWALKTRSWLGHLMWGGALLLRLWGRRSKTRSSLPSLSSHYSAEEIAWAMSDRGRSLGRAGMLWWSTDACWAGVASSGLELAVKA
jgi:hypothetical protein